MPEPLPEIERRVVGVLMEKLLSTPVYYPLTMNALMAGCNQKNNRDPEMDLSEDVLRRALERLKQRGLVVSVLAEGSRAEKWKVKAMEGFGLPSERAMAVLAELLLRGPQTKAELRSRASRMRHEISNEQIDEVLNEFQARPDPLAQNLGRAPGGRAERYAHTLYAQEELAKLRATSVPAAPAPRAAPAPPVEDADRDDAAGAEVGAGALAGVAARLETAFDEIAALRERVETLERAVAEMRGS